MTNEQAIDMLSEIRSGYNCFDEQEEPFYHALSMAIEALESQERQELIVGSYLIEEPSCSEKPNRSDLISRQDAIMHFVKASEKYECGMFNLAEVTHELWEIASAQPELNQGQSRFNQGQSSDLIRRSDAIDALYEEFYYELKDLKTAVDVIENLPSAQPERKKGEWIPYEFGDERWHKCTACGVADKYIDYVKGYDGKTGKLVSVRNYCPNCGADMR